jgi:hypothetical protein
MSDKLWLQKLRLLHQAEHRRARLAFACADNLVKPPKPEQVSFRTQSFIEDGRLVIDGESKMFLPRER